MNYEQLERKWGKKTDNRKLILAAIIVVVVAGITIYYLYPQEKFTIEKTVKLTSFEEFEIKPIDGESYWIRYEDSSCFLQNIIFSDNIQANDFLENYMTKVSNLTSNKTYFSIDDFDGYEFVTLNLDTKSPTGYGLTVRKDNYLIYGSCFDKNILEKVAGWFIKKFY